MSMIDAIQDSESKKKKISEKKENNGTIQIKIAQNETKQIEKIECKENLYPLFAFISDTHINAHQYHLPQRANDIFNTFKQAIDIIDAFDKNLSIIHGGDLFNSYSVKPSVIIDTARLIDDSRTMYVIRGNHDGSKIKGKRKDTALNLVDEMNDAVIYVESDIIQLANRHTINFIMQSYAGNKTMDKLNDLKEKLQQEQYQNGDFTVLVIHDIVEGTTPFGATIPREDILAYIDECEIDLILAGHLHTTIIDEEINLLNPGSIECLDIDQADQQRGFFLVGINTNTECLDYQFIPLKTRNMADIEINLGNIEERDINRIIMDQIERISIPSKSVVRFKITGTTETHLPRIDKKIFSEKFPDMLKITVANKISFEGNTHTNGTMLDPEDAVKNALRDLGVDDGKINSMATAVLEISNEASERNEGWQREIRNTVKEISR